jgi:hypothetical protein
VVLARIDKIKARYAAAISDAAGPWSQQYWPPESEGSGWDAELALRCESGGEVITAMGPPSYLRLLGNAPADIAFLLGAPAEQLVRSAETAWTFVHAVHVKQVAGGVFVDSVWWTADAADRRRLTLCNGPASHRFMRVWVAPVALEPDGSELRTRTDAGHRALRHRPLRRRGLRGRPL